MKSKEYLLILLGISIGTTFLDWIIWIHWLIPKKAELIVTVSSLIFVVFVLNGLMNKKLFQSK